ncbi:hypothetical protein P3S67_032266 [Capsicum chacoense]
MNRVVPFSHCVMEEFGDVMSDSKQDVENLLQQILEDVDNNIRCKYNMNHVLPSLMDNIDECISSCHRSTMTEDQLNFLLLNLHHISKYLAERIFPLETQYEILQNVCGNMKDFHGLIVNGCIKHESVQYVLPQFQIMAERVGLFLWDDRLFKIAHLLMEIIPIGLEVMHICYTNLNTSPSVEVGLFIKQLLETSPEVLREYLIHLQEHMVTVINISTSGARNIHVMIEFRLIILTDMPKESIHHDKLFDLLAREDLKYVYLKAPDAFQWSFPMSDGPLFLHLLHRHLNDLLHSKAYSVALIKEEIELVKEDLEFIRSFFVNVEQRLYKDLWESVLDAAYEAKDVIDSIIVRDNGLLHLIFSLPTTIKRIKLIKEEVSNISENIPKNRSLTAVNSTKKTVENKSLTAGKIIVGFDEEKNWIISKLTSGPKDLDIISITGMPGSGKTTLAYKVYNDESGCSHFDLCAWCTVDQKCDEKKLLMKLFIQVTGSDLKFSEEIDVADMLWRQLFGKRYLIVLDDVWDIDTWDDLTRPFPEAEKGSRILLTTRQKEVGFRGKDNTDPLNLRLLKPEESWELLEKRAFGKESFPVEILDVGKEIAQNCKGLPLVADLIAGVISVDVMKVIELSYDHLPHHMKPCFLYLAFFPKETALTRVMLKMSWHTERLVELTEIKSLEEVMEIYLDNLISNSLVIHFNEIGDDPTCQLHDLVHNFCLLKAREEKLFGKISSSDPSFFSDLMPRIVSIDYDKENFGPNNFFLFSSKKKRHSGKHLYSLKITGHEMVM